MVTQKILNLAKVLINVVHNKKKSVLNFSFILFIILDEDYTFFKCILDCYLSILKTIHYLLQG